MILISIVASTVLPAGEVLIPMVNKSFGAVALRKSMSLTDSVFTGTMIG
jgi:hypothetical protein